jgi:hypothetical protein|tara:strand:+ start:523 stop:630 length:108 start_codon:yes stop_codon:yes gene_type:complete
MENRPAAGPWIPAHRLRNTLLLRYFAALEADEKNN